MLTGLYLGSGVAILGVASLALFALQRAVGVPPPFRGHRLNPLLSPALALLGVLVSMVLSVSFVSAHANIGAGRVSGIAWDDIAWYVLCAASLVVVAYLTARWWQPLYLSTVVWTFFTVGALYEHYEGINEPEGQTARGLLIDAASAVPVLAALTSVGVLLAFRHLRASQRSRRPPANARRPLDAEALTPR
jgi:hypothetical protein